MEMNKKIVLVIGCILTGSMIVGGLITHSNTRADYDKNSVQSNQADTANKNLKVSFLEPKEEANELINNSDLVVKGKILNLKEKNITKVKKTDKTKKSSSIDKDSMNIEYPYCTYNVQVMDNIKNPYNVKNLELVLLDGSVVNTGLNSNEIITEGDEYLLFLSKNKNGQYSLLSYSQGLCKKTNDKNEFKTLDTNEQFDFNELKNKYTN